MRPTEKAKHDQKQRFSVSYIHPLDTFERGLSRPRDTLVTETGSTYVGCCVLRVHPNHNY